jgi:hypothetical protein
VGCLLSPMTTTQALNYNTVNWGNLLVTVFAKPYLDRIPNT